MFCKKYGWVCALVAILAVVGLVYFFLMRPKTVIAPVENTLPSVPADTVPVGMANPASVNCVDKGGQLQIQQRGDGGEYGICYFEDNRQCEEWSLMRGECPVGGLKITGYDNQSQVYCAITGGTVDMNKNTCTSKDKVCDLEEYFEGVCPTV